VTLTQLGAFVLVARLGSVRAAADVLGVSEPAVSKALASLRVHLADQLIVREGNAMSLTPGGARLLAIASQMVSLGAEAEAAVRAARGAPSQLRLLVSPTIAEFIAAHLVEAFGLRYAGRIETTAGVATAAEMRELLTARIADVALGPALVADAEHPLVCEAVLRYRLVVVAAPHARLVGPAARWQWLVGPEGTDPDSEVARLLRAHRVPDERVQVFPNEAAAWSAAASGAGVAPACATLVAPQLGREELRVVPTGAPPVEASWHVSTLRTDRRPAAAAYLCNFLGTPDALQVMCTPGAGVPPSRFRPPVYVTLWS
jgi:LysR family transcriptional regulator, low CO2-responsive transcriptional regulator